MARFGAIRRLANVFQLRPPVFGIPPCQAGAIGGVRGSLFRIPVLLTPWIPCGVLGPWKHPIEALAARSDTKAVGLGIEPRQGVLPLLQGAVQAALMDGGPQVEGADTVPGAAARRSFGIVEYMLGHLGRGFVSSHGG